MKTCVRGKLANRKAVLLSSIPANSGEVERFLELGKEGKGSPFNSSGIAAWPARIVQPSLESDAN